MMHGLALGFPALPPISIIGGEMWDFRKGNPKREREKQKKREGGNEKFGRSNCSCYFSHKRVLSRRVPKDQRNQ